MKNMCLPLGTFLAVNVPNIPLPQSSYNFVSSTAHSNVASSEEVHVNVGLIVLYTEVSGFTFTAGGVESEQKKSDES